jgi:hypothetical protein
MFSRNIDWIPYGLDERTKGQMKLKAVWACRRFSQKSKQNKLIRLFFGRIYRASICFWFYLTFTLSRGDEGNIDFLAAYVSQND